MKHVSRLKKATALLAALTCLAGSLLLPAQATETEAELTYEEKKAAYREKLKANDVTRDDFLIGSWVSFYSFDIDSYEYQLDQMADAGLNFNMFPRDFAGAVMHNAEYWEEIERQYAKRNMVYQMNGGMGEHLIALGVEYSAGKEHCIGYHLTDEPRGDALPAVTDMIKLYREADPNLCPLVNLLPNYAGPEILGGTYYEYVSTFVELAGPENIEYLSHDFYPFPTHGTSLEIFADMEVLRSIAYENGKLKTHAFTQGSGWAGMRMPNIDEMRWNVYGYLAYGFKALSWFNLVNPTAGLAEGEDGLIYADGSIPDPELFAAWGELNWEVRGLSDILMNLDTAHAYHVKANVDGVEKLPEDFFLQPANRNDFIISVMEPKEGEDQYVMIFNKSVKRGVDSQFTVDPSSGVQWLEYFDPRTGEYIPMTLTDGLLEDSLLPGEGKLYRLRYDTPPSETEVPTETAAEVPTEPVTDASTEAVVTGPATDTVTDSVTTDAPTADGGCISVVGVGSVAVMAVAAYMIRKRKED